MTETGQLSPALTAICRGRHLRRRRTATLPVRHSQASQLHGRAKLADIEAALFRTPIFESLISFMIRTSWRVGVTTIGDRLVNA